MKKIIVLFLALILVCGTFAGCSTTNSTSSLSDAPSLPTGAISTQSDESSTQSEESSTQSDTSSIQTNTSSSTQTNTSSTRTDTSSTVVSSEETYQKPENYAAVVKLKINPEFNIYVNMPCRVLAVEPINNDAKKVIKHATTKNKSIADAIQELVLATEQEGILKKDAKVDIEVIEIKDKQTKINDVLEYVADSLKIFADKLDVKIDINITFYKEEDTNKENSSTVSSNPAQPSEPTQSGTTSQTSRPAPSTDPEPTVTIVDPANIKLATEYLGNFKVTQEGLSAALLQFEEGGVMFGTRYFSKEPSEHGQLIGIEYKGTGYYSLGAGFNGNVYRFEGKEIIIEKPDGSGEILLKLTLSSDGKLTIVYSDVEAGSLLLKDVILEPDVKKVD